MVATDDANKDGIYKKLLAPDMDVHEAQRQVNIHYYRTMSLVNLNLKKKYVHTPPPTPTGRSNL